MESVIDHCCYTFMREVLVWKITKNGKSQYMPSDEIPDEIRNEKPGVLMVLQPQYPGVKSGKTGFFPCDSLNLTITEDDYAEYCRLKDNPWANKQEFLNQILLKKLKSIEELYVNTFLRIQMDFYLQRSGKSIAFFAYTKNLAL